MACLLKITLYIVFFSFFPHFSLCFGFKRSLVLCCKNPYLYKKLVPRNHHFCCISLLCTVCIWHTGVLWGSQTPLPYKNSHRFIKKNTIAINNPYGQLLSSRLISKDLFVTLVQATCLSSRDKQILHELYISI